MGIVVLIAMVLALCVGIYFCLAEHQMKYFLLFEYTVDNKNVGTWKVISENGFYTQEMFAKEYELATGEALPITFNTHEHEYIVCYGYTLEGVSYREADKVGRFTSSKPYYCAKAVLKKSSDMHVYVYEVDRSVTIDRDIHTNVGNDTVILRK